MSRFNSPKTSKSQKQVVNRAGGEAYDTSNEYKLVSILLTSFIQNQYYRSADQTMDELTELVGKVDPLFAAKTAIYARQKFGMRSVTHYVAAELARYVSGKDWGKRFYDQVIKRPDDMLEIAALILLSEKDSKLPNAVKKGFAKAFDKFDAYQLAKYRGEGKSVKLVDIVNLVHPIPTERNAQALKELVEGTLKNTDTWESKMTEAGQKGTSKTQVWGDLLSEGKIGYLALVRNLNNILATNDSNVIKMACDQLVIKNKIFKSLVMPFQLLVAFTNIKEGTQANQRLVKKALEAAVDISVANIPNMPNTLVVVDNSGSMSWSNVNETSYKFSEVAAMLGMMLAKRNNSDIMEFGDRARYINYNLNNSVLEFGKNFSSLNQVGHGTNFNSIFETASGKYERVIILSDMQGWVDNYRMKQSFADFKRKNGIDPFLYSIDLHGYGSLMFPENKVATIAGFNTEIFKIMELCEQDKDAMIKEINKIEL